jgi:hypothetical protein
MSWCVLVLLGAVEAREQKVNDLEFGLKGEIPFVTGPSITETGLGKGPGDSQLHLGFEAFGAYALTQQVYLTGLVGTRRRYMDWEPHGDLSATGESRALRVALGGRVSLLKPPTFVALNLGGGWVSGWWQIQLGAAPGDLRWRGPLGYAGVQVDHFLNPHFALTGELRGWGELQGAGEISHDMGEDGTWRFEHPAAAGGLSLLVGFTFR